LEAVMNENATPTLEEEMTKAEVRRELAEWMAEEYDNHGGPKFEWVNRLMEYLERGILPKHTYGESR
jgi:hypothetical protein